MYVTRKGNTVSKLAVIVADKFGLSEVIPGTYPIFSYYLERQT